VNKARIKPQRNGLFEPYTVMLHERPHVIEADSLESAKVVAEKACELKCKLTNKSQEVINTIEEEGDAS